MESIRSSGIRSDIFPAVRGPRSVRVLKPPSRVVGIPLSHGSAGGGDGAGTVRTFRPVPQHGGLRSADLPGLGGDPFTSVQSIVDEADVEAVAAFSRYLIG